MLSFDWCNRTPSDSLNLSTKVGVLLIFTERSKIETSIGSASEDFISSQQEEDVESTDFGVGEESV